MDNIIEHTEAQITESLGYVTAGILKQAISRMDNDTELSFEMIVASFFPDAYKNMQSLIKDAYTQGYMQAKEEDMQ